MGIGSKIEQNMQLQEFVERIISYVFNLAQDDEFVIEEICEEMGITTDEAYWLFEQLGYEREES